MKQSTGIRVATVGLLLGGVGLVACASSALEQGSSTGIPNTDPGVQASPSPLPSDDFTFEHNQEISGIVNAEVLRVPADATVWIVGETEITCTEMYLDGKLIIRDAEDLAPTQVDAPGLTIHASGAFQMKGSIAGGAGRSFGQIAVLDGAGRRGGDGSDITIVSPDLMLVGCVTGGNGGSAGCGASGGDGGDVITFGQPQSTHGLTAQDMERRAREAQLLGGTGGSGYAYRWVGQASPEARGGCGGSALALPFTR